MEKAADNDLNSEEATIGCHLMGFYMQTERLSGRAARLWCRKSSEGREFEAGLLHPTTGKLFSVNTAVNITYVNFDKHQRGQ